mmetsp:Transcript_94188/g.155736  ORF Transcript_94188/g.155736 Transcript_94188/m.155736 type:complete len:494 (+) Transcript_94188:139-1620(+)
MACATGPPRLQLPENASLEYITDVEGNWEYFCALVERSAVLSWRPDAGPTLPELELEESSYFVFGGDAQDKGPGDIRITRALVLLQRQHPDRVFLLIGNRDCNKIRMLAELATGEFPDRDPVGYLDQHNWEGKKQQFAAFLAEQGLERSPFNALQWLLSKTFGAVTGIETRKAELELLGRPSGDDDVLASFRELVDPAAAEPWTLEYLRVGRVMLVIGDCLFIHGAVTSKGLLLVPAEDCRDGAFLGQPPPLRLPDSTPVCAWADELNAWKARQLRLFEAFPYFRQNGADGIDTSVERWRGGQPLMMPSLSGAHIITDGFLKGGNCAPLDEDVEAYLAREGIRRVVAGHQPQGQCPGVTRCPKTGVVVLVADTSFSDVSADKSRNPADNRGRAISTVVITRSTTSVQGVLADGTAHGYELQADEKADRMPEAFIGRRFADDSWGKTLVERAPGWRALQLCRGEGFRQHFELVDLASARERLDPAYALPDILTA